MWYLEKDVTVSAAHHLNNYEGKCKELHGHSWQITIYCRGGELDDAGILVDFTKIKAIVNQMDHGNLNDLEAFRSGRGYEAANPTAENIAKYLCEQIPHCYKVMVQEEVGSRCYYVKG